VGQKDDKATKNIEEKFNKFITDEKLTRLSYTFDIYTEKENFIVIQGIKSEGYAKNVASILKDDKKYKITEPAIVISSDNYKVVQIKKNLAEYLSPQKTVAVPNPAVPQQGFENSQSTEQEKQKQETPASKSNRTRPPVGIPNKKDSDSPNSTPKQ
jgi:hypothetical protein